MSGITKWVPTITGQGNERAVAGSSLNLNSGGSPGLDWRSEWAENWQAGAVQNYSYTGTTAGGWQVADPSGRKFASHITGMLYESSIGSSTGTAKITRMTYAQDAGLSYRSNPRVVESKVVDIANANNTRRATTSYLQAHGVWLPNELIEYNADYTTVYRKTVTSYLHYSTQRIIGLPHKVAVYNAANTKLAESENVYDKTGNYTDSNNQTASYFLNATGGNIIQHDDANYGFSFTARGNLTCTLQYNSGTGSGARAVKYVSYDTNGNVRATADGARKCCDGKH